MYEAHVLVLAALILFSEMDIERKMAVDTEVLVSYDFAKLSFRHRLRFERRDGVEK